AVFLIIGFLVMWMGVDFSAYLPFGREIFPYQNYWRLALSSALAPPLLYLFISHEYYNLTHDFPLPKLPPEERSAAASSEPLEPWNNETYREFKKIGLEIVAWDESFIRVLEQVKEIGESGRKGHILVIGKTGTGKELVAQALHRL